MYTDGILEKTATTLVCRNRRLRCFLKTRFSVSYISAYIQSCNSQGLFLEVPQWDLFSGTYWKHYQRKLIASDPATLCFSVCFLLCLWFSLDLLQLWFIFIFCFGIYCSSLHIPCILLSVTSSLFSEVWDYFEMTSRPLSFPSAWHWLSRSLSEPDSKSAQHVPLDSEFLLSFSVTVIFLNQKKY